MLAARHSFRLARRVAGTVAVAGGAGLGVGLVVCAKEAAYPPQRLITHNEGLFDSHNSNNDSFRYIVPTLEATGRVLRLAQTAVLMALDYKLATVVVRTTSHDQGLDNDDNKQQKYWEAEAHRRRLALEQAQEVYSTESHPGLDVVARLEFKRHEKEEMNRAAVALAEAEEELARVGSLKSRVHRKAAQRLLELCQVNKGVYIKVGQHLASLDYLIPQEYIETLALLFDNNPQTSYEDVRQVVKEDLGQYPEDLFESFHETPIASASLAQVHVAYEKETGRKLAVKVQHRGLRETSAGDIFALVTVVCTAERLFPDSFTWGWLADEIAPQLPKELDFVNEGRNAERAARDLATTGLDCVVPKVVWRHSSPRVLTMEFEEGFKATDMDAIAKNGLRKSDVAKLISSVFSSQVFLSRWVHCDPHPANVLLRAKNGKPQLVLVDHGLYRELDSDFRKHYAALWKSLMLADLKGIKDSCHSLGVDKAYSLFAAMLTARPFDEMIERSKKGTLRSQSRAGSRVDQAVIRGYAQRFLHDIFDLLGTIPRQMLLLLKMNDCLRHIDYSLGSPTNTMIICGKYAALSIYEDCLRESSSLVEKLNAWCSYMYVLTRIKVHDLTVWWLENVLSL